MKRKIVLGLVFLAVSLSASENEMQKVEEARRIVTEYETGERMRAAVALANAKKLIDGDERGRKETTAEQLMAARDLIQKNNEQQAAERQSAIDAVPVFTVLRRGSTLDLGRLLDAANREYLKSRIVELKSMIEGHEESGTGRARKELQTWENALADLKPTGKVLGGIAATIFEERDRFVVAYFESTRMEHFVCCLGKDAFTPLPRPELSAFNATQKEVLILD
jgi:hypothetical protein